MDNAFEKARAAYGTGAYDDATLEFIFPKLKESDEKKMEKAIAVLKQQREFWSYDGPADKTPPATKRTDLVEAMDVAISNLEKQKDHFRDDTKMVEQMLEWAKEKYEEYDRRIAGFPDDGAYWGQRNAFRQMIDKLNSI